MLGSEQPASMLRLLYNGQGHFANHFRKDISVHLIIRTAGAVVNLAIEFVAQPVLTNITGEEAGSGSVSGTASYPKAWVDSCICSRFIVRLVSVYR